MKSNYKRIGEFIIESDERNTFDKDLELWGVSIDKKFIKSVANIIGTDLTKYKAIEKDCFVCSLMQVSRDEKIPIARWNKEHSVLVSPAYKVFKVKDENVVLPEYMNLWFKRAEFDREASYYGVGGVRGSLEWSDFCDMRLPIPSLPEQQKIVDAYNTIERRIELKRKINENLETQMQNLFNKELACLLSSDNLSANYSIIPLSEMAEYINGLAMQNYTPKNEIESLSVLKIRELRQGYCDLNSDKCTSKLPTHITIQNGDIIFSWSGSLLVDIWSGGNAGLNQHLFNVVSNLYPKWLVYLWTKYYLSNFIRIADGKKTSMGHIKREDLDAAKVVVPQGLLLEQLNEKYAKIFSEILSNKIELNTLRQIQNLLLSTLSR